MRFLLGLALCVAAGGAEAPFKAGFARRDITPDKPVQMWGYFRHDRPSQGVLDPLEVAAVVLETGKDKLAIVGLDLGRAPTEPMMESIRAAVREQSGVNWVMISGSHTHHGPIIEMKDEPGKGQGKYPDSVAYAQELPGRIIDCINEAAARAVPAKLGWGSEKVDLNFNRQTRIEPKPTEPELGVLRLDALDGTPIALVVNYAAHPSIAPEAIMKFSADWPGRMKRGVEAATNSPCIYIPGAAGDMDGKIRNVEGMGGAVAEKVVVIARGIQTRAPAQPGIVGMEDSFAYPSRLDFSQPFIRGLYKSLFFPEVANALMDEFPNNTVRPRLLTLLLNGELALVGASGEFFCQHANRLKRDSAAPETFFFGYCNGYHMYFPTREAVAEGGFGADPSVSFVAVGAGEEMIGKALENIASLIAQHSRRGL